MPDFRVSAPSRNCHKTYIRYRSYKKHLVKDFSNRCGYCDGSDTWNGGYKTFHIDHFAPKDKFPKLETEYSNLIYACPSCNSAKSNKWASDNPNDNIVGNIGFLNPVTDDLNQAFSRDDFGNIRGNTEVAEYMIVNLNLHLERHSVIWMLTRLEILITKSEQILSHGVNEEGLKNTIEKIHYNLLKIFFEYHSTLRSLNL